ncbi:YncE family protein [Mycobacterium sp. TY815]|uniref:YncE family protein n=1 Tax=Mycobacterium sp. TY815 TaxID=3050581 RepID=UPI003532159A
MLTTRRALFKQRVVILASLLVTGWVGSGCSSNPLSYTPPTIEPAQPAVSPPASNPAGVVQSLGGRPQSAFFDGDSRQLVVLSPGDDPGGPGSIAVLGPRGAARVITLPGPATAMTGDGHGTVYLAGRDGYVTVALATGQGVRTTVAGGQEFTAIARRADGRLVLGSADGAVYSLGADGSVANRNKIFARVDALVAQANTTVVLDRGQTSVTTIGPDGRAAQSLRAGEGATTLAADSQGRVLVADTRGGQLLVYGIDPLILRQAFPVRQSPYGLAGSRQLAWVSQTASNTVIGYDLSTGIPVEKVRYPTVQQPNSLAFDEASDTLYVVSGSGAGVQIIEHAGGAP